jgi:hypothetical protein
MARMLGFLQRDSAGHTDSLLAPLALAVAA